jgi:hypothetical protein
MTRAINPEPRRCCVCDQREKAGMDFHAHEDACVRAQWANKSVADEACTGVPTEPALLDYMATVEAGRGR